MALEFMVPGESLSTWEKFFNHRPCSMTNKVFLALTLLILSPFFLHAQTATSPDKITGQWMAAKNNLIVEVFKSGATYNARIVWFNDSDDPSKPMKVRLDTHNSNPSLRSRHILGMQVVSNLVFDPAAKTWDNGIIYDARTGREWSSYAYMAENGILRVKGYWHFKFLGESMDFHRFTPEPGSSNVTFKRLELEKSMLNN